MPGSYNFTSGLTSWLILLP